VIEISPQSHYSALGQHYSHYQSVDQFRKVLSGIDMKAPVRKPVVERLRTGCDSFVISMVFKKNSSFEHYVIEVMDYVNDTKWTTKGTTVNDNYRIVSLHHSTKYRVRVAAKMKGVELPAISEDVWEEATGTGFWQTLKMDRLYAALIAPDLEKRIAEMKDRIRKGMIEAGKEMGITRYKYIVIGDCGAGKSSYLNTLETAYMEDNVYIEKYQTGCSDVNSTTVYIYNKPIAGCFAGTDLPGINGNNYSETAKLHAILEGRIPDRVMLDSGDWAKRENQRDFHPKNMVHMVFFVIAYDGLRKKTIRERYRDIKEKMTSYKNFGLNGYHPYLIITKADTFDDDYSVNKIRIYDDARLMEDRDEFCKEANFDPAKAIFIPNYVNGLDFSKEKLVDYVALFIADSALANAKLLIETVRDAPEVVKILETPPSPVIVPRPDSKPDSNSPLCVSSDCINNGKPVGKFCPECGKPGVVPAPPSQAMCQQTGCENFGKPVSGKFCHECGNPPAVSSSPPSCRTPDCINFSKPVSGKFCNECGKPPSSSSGVPKCQAQSCTNFGQPVKGKFCSDCGQPPSIF
jgi:GTPase SAR1 family protein